MNPLLFDIRGNLQALPFIELSLDETERIFVEAFEHTSKRYELFNEYKRYTHDLRKVIGQPFYQWVDGSFTSTSFNPSDIDLISFISHDTYTNKELLIDERFSKWSVSQHYSGLDAYTVWTYPADHKRSVLFEADCAYWQDWFGHTRYRRDRKRFTKGYIQVNIE